MTNDSTKCASDTENQCQVAYFVLHLAENDEVMFKNCFCSSKLLVVALTTNARSN